MVISTATLYTRMHIQHMLLFHVPFAQTSNESNIQLSEGQTHVKRIITKATHFKQEARAAKINGKYSLCFPSVF